MGTRRVMRRRKSTSTLWEGVTGTTEGSRGLVFEREWRCEAEVRSDVMRCEVS